MLNWRYIIAGVLFLCFITQLYDAGKYSAGYEETRKGDRWVIYSLASAFANILMSLILILNLT